MTKVEQAVRATDPTYRYIGTYVPIAKVGKVLCDR